MSESAPGRASSDSNASDKEFVCSECGDTLSQSASLYHVRNVCEEAGVDCPECERSFTNQRGVKSHYAREHEGTLYEVDLECDWCGEEYQTEPYKAERGDHNFCGQKCWGEWFSHNEELHKDRERVQTECANCSAELELKPSHYKKDGNNFCNRECSSEWKSENITGEKHPNWEGGKSERECTYCGSSVHRYKRQFRAMPFCDHDCYGAWLSENKSGENSTRWKGGDTLGNIYYGPNWIQQKKKALRRDQYRCQRCFKSENELTRKPDVHHLKRIRWYKNNLDAPEWYKKGNKLDNLVCLCPSCHRKWEGIPLRPQ